MLVHCQGHTHNNYYIRYFNPCCREGKKNKKFLPLDNNIESMGNSQKSECHKSHNI